MPRNFESKYNSETKTLELRMFGVVGEDVAGDGTFIDATAVAQALANKPERIIATINSRGGSVFHGLAIYEMLKTSGAHVSGQIVGLCGSIMSVIAAACDSLEMNSAALMMIHEASGAVSGRSSEMRMTAEITDKLNDSQVDIFTARTGKSPEEIRAMLAAETWMTAREALACRFITGISSAKTIAAEFQESNFSNVPAHILPILADLQAKGPTDMADQKPDAPAAAPQESATPEAFNKWAKSPAAEEALKAAYANYLRESADKLSSPEPVEQPEEESGMETPDAIAKAKAEARTEEMNRQTTIRALCETAKRPDLAAAFCKDVSITVADVQTKLFEALCKQNGPLGDEGGTAGETQTAKTTDDKYRAEYAANSAYSKAMTVEDYVAMRRIDDGLDVLQPKTCPPII